MDSDLVTVRALVSRDTYRALQRYARDTGRPLANVAGGILGSVAYDEAVVNGNPIFCCPTREQVGRGHSPDCPKAVA